jgi:hypothetical protein
VATDGPEPGRPVVPAPFRARRAMRVLNVTAVGLALAAITVVLVGAAFHGEDASLSLAWGASTWVVGSLWAALLRSQKTVTRRSIRIGWLLSPPLAMLNAALASGALFAAGPPSHLTGSFFIGALLGATFGAFVWVPALVATLICFGLPIARAQRLAAKGLAGEERGELIVGLVCVAVSVAAVVLSRDGDGTPRDIVAPWLGVAGLFTGGGAALLAGGRERRRRRFVADAEAGKVAGYRVDATAEGKVLVRVAAQGRGYRVADFEEEVFELDEQGQATRAKSLTAMAEGELAQRGPRE